MVRVGRGGAVLDVMASARRHRMTQLQFATSLSTSISQLNDARGEGSGWKTSQGRNGPLTSKCVGGALGALGAHNLPQSSSSVPPPCMHINVIHLDQVLDGPDAAKQHCTAGVPPLAPPPSYSNSLSLSPSSRSRSLNTPRNITIPPQISSFPSFVSLSPPPPTPTQIMAPSNSSTDSHYASTEIFPTLAGRGSSITSLRRPLTTTRASFSGSG